MVFTAFSLRDSKPLTDEELAWLHKMLAQYSASVQGLWLKSLPWTRFQFRWCPAMNGDNGVIGCFSPLHPGTIFLQPFENADIAIKDPSGRVTWIEEIFPTIIHELCHAKQWKLSKIAYVICALPGLRTFTLEKDANLAGEDAREFTERWIAKHDYIAASKRGMAESVLPEEADNGKSE